MSPLVRRAFALALVALLAPTASAQTSVPEEPPAEPPPGVADCTAPLEECLPDLIPMNPRRSTGTDERFPSTLCTDFSNIGRAPVTTPFRVLLTLDGVAVSDKLFNGPYQQGQGEANVCWSDLLIAAGRHEMVITVDANAQVPESDERNNVRGVLFFVNRAPQVDLRVRSFDVTPREGAPRQNQIFSVTVYNGGSKPSEASTVDISDTNGAIATLKLIPLAPGEETTVAHATRPDIRPVGTFIARAVVDPLGNNSELSETNNDALLEYTVLEHPTADLVITDLDVSGSRMEFRGLLVNATVRNVGDKPVRGITIRTFNESDLPMGQGESRTTIFPNGSAVVQLRLVLRAGDRVLRLVVDPDSQVMERNETNNERWLEVTIVAPETIVEEPNLIIERVFAMPRDPAPGETVTIGALVRNVGTNRSHATVLNFSIDGKPAGSTPIPSLGVDLTHTGYITWRGTADGLHAITAIADGPSKITELDEGDNALMLEVFVAKVEPEDPEPSQPTPPPPPPVTPPTPTTPTPPTAPVTPTRPPPTSSEIAFGDLLLEPRPIPGGVKGIISVTLRNPSLDPIGLVTVQFKVDGKLAKEVLVGGIPGAATRPATSGEIDLPEGAHKVTAEVRVVGSSAPALVREKEYDVEAGAKEGIPAPPALLVLVLLAAIALARRRSG